MIVLLFASLYTDVPHIYVWPEAKHCRYMAYPAKKRAELLPNCIVPPGGRPCPKVLRLRF
jgi:hypothetical protein